MKTLTGLIMAGAVGLAAAGTAQGQGTETLPDPGGQPLSAEERAALEAAMGQDLSSTRAHTDADGKGAAADIGARAFTNGSDVTFGPGQTGGAEGGRLMAHELAHTLQQQSRTSEQGDEESEESTETETERRARDDGRRPRQEHPRQQRRRPDQR